MSNVVYVASPIDRASESEKQSIETEIAFVKEALRQAGYSVFVPALAWDSGVPHDAIHQVNMEALEKAIGLVVVGATKAHSIGIYIEVGYMHARRRPVAFFRQKPESITLSEFPVIRYPENLPPFFDMFFKDNQAAIGYWEEKPGQFEPPRRAYPGDAGFDLATAEDFLVTPLKNGEPAHRIPLAHRLFPPEGFWFLLAERSSTRDRWGVEIIPGVMDNGYTGPWFARTVLRRDEPVMIPAGTRLVQAIPIPVALEGVAVRRVSEIPATKRGESGFGSSDKKEVGR